MADNENVGVVGLGVQLDQSDILSQFNKVTVSMAGELGKALGSVKMDASGIKKSFQDQILSAIKDNTRAFDLLSDNISEAIANGAKTAKADVAEALKEASAVDPMKVKKIDTSYSNENLQDLANNYYDQFQLARKEAEKARAELDKLRAEYDQAKTEWSKLTLASNPDANPLQGFDSSSFEEGIDKAQRQFLKLEQAAIQARARVDGVDKKLAELANNPVAQTLDDISEKTRNVAREASRAGFDTMARNAKKAGQDIELAMKRSAKSVSGINKETGKAKIGFGKLGRAALAMFGIRSAYMLIRKAVSSVTDSLKSASAQFPGMAQQMNALTQAGSQLKGAFASMAMPLINLVTPALVAVMNKVTELFNTISIWIARLTGQAYALVSTGSTESFYSGMQSGANATKKAAGEAKKLKRELAGFDELEVLSFDKGGGSGGGDGGGGGGGAGPVGPVFDKVAVEGLDIKGKLQEMFGNLDLFPKTRESAKEAFDFILEKGQEAKQKVQKAWEESAPKIKESWTNIGKNMHTVADDLSANIFVPFVSGALGAGIEAGGSLVAGIIEVFASWSGFADSLFDPFAKAVDEFFDKYGEDIKEKIYETWNAVGEGMSDVIDGLVEDIKQPLDGLKEWFNTHGEEIKTLLVETWSNVWEFIGPIWNTISESAQKIFGELSDFFHEIAPKIRDVVVNAVDMAWSFIKPVWEIMNEVGKVIFGGLTAFFEKVWTRASGVFSAVWELISGLFKTKLDFLSGVFSAFSLLFKGDWEGFWNKMKDTFKQLLDNIKNTFSNVLGSITKTLRKLGIDVDGIFGGIKQTFRGIINFIKGVFTGDWRRAWNGVKDIFSGIVNTFGNIFKTPLNHIIDLMNGFISGMNKIKIPDWVPGVGGKGINISRIPRLAKGGIVDTPTLSLVGEAGKEAVVPLENNTEWIEQIARKIQEHGGGGGDMQVTIPVYLGGELLDVVIAAFDRHGRQTNKPVLEG